MNKFFLLVLIFFSYAGTPNNKTVKFSLEEYPPYVTSLREDGGLLSVIVREAFALEGISVSFKFFPGKRAFENTKSGYFDGSFPWADRKERHKDFYYGESLITADDEYFFYKKGFDFEWDAKNQDYSKIKGMKVAAIIGSHYGVKFQLAEKNKIIDVYRVSSLAQAFKMVEASRVQVVISPERVARYQIRKGFTNINFAFDDKIAIDDYPKEHDFAIFSKKSPNGKLYSDTFDRSIKKLKESGRYQEIINSYKY